MQETADLSTLGHGDDDDHNHDDHDHNDDDDDHDDDEFDETSRCQKAITGR